MPWTLQLRALWAKLDLQACSVWLLGFGLVAYLGLEGGGYEPIVRDQLGIAIWWGVLLGLAVGALPLNRLRYGSWIVLALLAAYVCWVALSCIWTDATHNTVEDLGRVVTYLGVFALALSIRGPKGARRMVGAVGSAIVVIAVVALLSRFHPAWFPAAREQMSFLPFEQGRLSYPLGYWNGLAALVAIGLPLVLYVACCARHVLTQALAAAALSAMALTVYFTLSRGGTAASIVGLIVFMALAHDRVAKAATLLIASVGAAILILATSQRSALNSGLTGPLAHHQGNEMLVMTLVVCAGVGLLQAALALALRHGQRPTWTRPSRRVSQSLLVACLAVAAIVVVGFVGSGKVSHAWHEFKASSGTESGAGRLSSVSSNGRWPYWTAVVKEFESAPIVGKGSGSYEVWWAQHRADKGGFVRDAHSLYLETLGELGIVGFALIVGFLGWVLWMGISRYARAARSSRTRLAAALAGCAAFCFGTAFDWLWEIAVIPIAVLLLASVLVSAGERSRRAALPVAARLAGVGVALAALVAIAIPLSSALALQKSQAEFRGGDLSAAMSEAADARRVEPFASQPRMQEALVLEAEGRIAAALVPVREATRLEPHEWRAWVVRSRIEAENGHPTAALASYRMARSLNPHSVLFSQ